jgi:hypothetical protein
VAGRVLTAHGSSGPPIGDSMTEMVQGQRYEKQRDDEFNAHVCAKQPRQRAI